MPLAAAINGYAEFELDLEEAIRTQLPPLLDSVGATPLTLASAQAIPVEAQGAYLLFYDGVLVYVGKSDAEAGLRKRLERHSFKVQHRTNLDPTRVTFKAARIFSFSVIDVETLLIAYYAQRLGQPVKWNSSGFGSNDPGRERDTQEPSIFDSAYPIDISLPLALGSHALPNPCDVEALLKWLRPQLPYTLRFRDQNGELRNAKLDPATVVSSTATMTGILQGIVDALPPGWQATALKGCVILYRETRQDYKSPTLIVRS
jgi:hypothetical protein